MKYLVLFFFMIQISFAQEVQTIPFPSEGSIVIPEKVKPEESPIEQVIDDALPIEKVDPTKFRSRDYRNQSSGTVMLGYQFVTSWLPSKKTLSYNHIFNERWTLEGEFSWATINFPIVGIDLGEIKEKRYTLQARRFVGNSFHFSFGAVMSDFKARLGSDMLDSFGNEINSAFRVQNIGVTGGIGNRWQWSNGFTFGIDWLRLNIPVIETKVDDNVLDDIASNNDRDDIKKVIRTLNRIPTFVLFGLNIGYSF